MKEPLKFGIIGTGSIAKTFAKAVALTDCAKVTAVCSRSQEQADLFCKEYTIPVGCCTEDDFYAQDIQAVYVAVPHSHHYLYAKKALEAGKHVLCEKAFTVNAAQAEALVSLAKEKQLFLMEAMWSRFIPAKLRLLQWIADGRIGEIRNISADFSFACDYQPEQRLFSPALAGGALLDTGIYCLSFICSILGNHPAHISSAAFFYPNGVDKQNTVTLQYPNALANFTTGTSFAGNHLAVVYGSKGRIEVPHFFCPQKIILWKNSDPSAPADQFSAEFSSGYVYEIKHMAECIAQGKTESPVMPLRDTVEIMQICDKIRSQWGLVYPCE